MKATLAQIKNIINSHKDTLRSSFYVQNIGIFGSLARGENTQSSDIDILIELSQPVGLFKFIHLENYLSQIIGKKVDLVTKNALKPAIKEEILQETVYV